MRILIVAGGTGGHIYPAVALLDYLKKLNKSCFICWIGGRKRLDREIVQKKGIEFREIKAQPLPRSFHLKWMSFILNMFISFIQSLKIILTFKPEVVVGMGSFQSYPVVVSAWLLGIPTVICEQNVYLSLTNKMLLPLASKIALSFPYTENYVPVWAKKKVVVTGNPVREEIITTSKRLAVKKLGLKEEKFTLLFLGGSQGAHYLNKVTVETLYLFENERIGEKIQFILLTGERDYSWVRENLKKIKIEGKIFPYLEEIFYAYAASDLVISRSGATTLAEIIARGLPCILIPYPFATCNHQLKNALILKKEGGAKVIIQEKLNPVTLKKAIEEIIEDKQIKERMQKIKEKWKISKATKNLTDLIIQLVGNRE